MVSVPLGCALAEPQARRRPVRSHFSTFAGNNQWSGATRRALKVSALLLFSPAVGHAQGMFPAAPNAFAGQYQSRLLAPLQRLSPVTDAMLADPPPQEWLMWRRTYDGWGFSPLRQITRKNVGTLQVAWSWSMTSGAMEATPLVHDGVLFIQNYGDNVEALNAENGDLLWRYDHAPPPAGMRGFKKTMAIHGERLFLATSDHALVALDLKTGHVVWEKKVAGEGAFTGGPMFAGGVLMVGTTVCVTARCFISGHDPETGNELWRFYTVAASNEPGGGTWNGLPDDARFGGSVWTSGSYDPKTGIAYWGTGQPYPWNGVARGTNALRDGQSNELLYTDNTLALDPRSGHLLWHYSHLPNDNWDMDYAFERQLLQLDVHGERRELVVTTGKLGIVEALDARSGRFVFAYDLGLQNIVSAIDAATGGKNINPAIVPSSDNTVYMCPHPGGARSLGASSYDPRTRILYLPMQEHCADMTSVPREPGERTNLPHFVLRLRPGSDGNIGRLEAIDLATGKPVWMHRERAPMSSGALATAGGVVFQGVFDRYFKAVDSSSGKVLWQVRLNDIPTSYPITYEVHGRQYVAISTGSGSPYSNTWGNLLPEVRRPVTSGAVLWVFRLPGGSVRGTPDILVPGERGETSATEAGEAPIAPAPVGATSEVGSPAEVAALQAPYYSRTQVQHGARAYDEFCASCHGRSLNDGQFGPPLKGTSFERAWAGRSLGALGSFLQQRMPPGAEGSMTLEEYTDLLAYLLSVNGVPAGDNDLPADSNAWNGMAMPQ
jgi:PQQ-dependent dehydrogenase (methanol/ethanol family)